MSKRQETCFWSFLKCHAHWNTISICAENRLSKCSKLLHLLSVLSSPVAMISPVFFLAPIRRKQQCEHTHRPSVPGMALIMFVPIIFCHIRNHNSLYSLLFYLYLRDFDVSHIKIGLMQPSEERLENIATVWEILTCSLFVLYCF